MSGIPDLMILSPRNFPGCDFQQRGHRQLMLAIHPRQASAPELFSAKGSQSAKLEHAELTWTLDPMDHGYLTSSSNQGRILWSDAAQPRALSVVAFRLVRARCDTRRGELKL